MKRHRTLLNYLGLLGILSFLSYTLAVCLSPLAYPGYEWMRQAVSDLSASTAPSLGLWNQLSSLYGPCALVTTMVALLHYQGKGTRIFRLGADLFATMEWVSEIGYSAFPLTEAGSPTGFQNVMHLVVTALVVLLSIVSLLAIFLGTRKRGDKALGNWALVAFLFMLWGALGVNLVPPAYFGIPERFSVFAASAFTMVLGLHVWKGEA